MKTKIIEVTNATDGGINWGKFLVGRLEPTEQNYVSTVDHSRFLNARWSAVEHIWVADLETGEGAFFRHGGLASHDLNRHAIWVCPMFEPFLNWLYDQDITDLDALPALVELTEEEAPSAMAGYRRPGPPTVHDVLHDEDIVVRTKTGKILTDEDFEALADEAERGYDL